MIEFLNRKLTYHLFIILGIVIGLALGVAINYVHEYINDLKSDIVRLEAITETATDAGLPPIKAIRLKDFYEWNNSIYIRMEFLKIRECGPPESVDVYYTKHNANNIIKFDNFALVDNKGTPGRIPRGGTVDPYVWNVTGWWKINPPVDNVDLYVIFRHICPVTFVDNDNTEITDRSPNEIVTRSYGPFHLKDALREDPFA